MLNHARTLLLNLDGSQSPGQDYLAEELIPEGYRKLSLPTYLETVRRQLFGADPDRAMLNYRGRQFLQLLHSSPLEQFVTELDSRISYDFDKDRSVLLETFKPQVTQVSGVSASLSILGSPATPDAQGRLKHSYVVDVLGETVKVSRQTPEFKNYILDLSLSNGLSPTYDLPGYGYQFKLNTDNPACMWLIEGYLQPQWDLGQLAANLTSLGETTTVQLFGITNQEPYSTFRNLWFQHKELPYRLGGLLLAMIYRTEEVRRQHG